MRVLYVYNIIWSCSYYGGLKNVFIFSSQSQQCLITAVLRNVHNTTIRLGLVQCGGQFRLYRAVAHIYYLPALIYIYTHYVYGIVCTYT